MKIRKNVKCFHNGSLGFFDLDENGRIVGKGDDPKPKSAASPPDQNKKPTKQELMATLKKMGVKFKATLGNVALQAMIDENTKPEAGEGEGGEEADSQSTEDTDGKGTGNQDVI
jgi:hypothetical protein